jgi:ketosteroid isomerase-like protein
MDEPRSSADEAEIQALINEQVAAIRNKDSNGALVRYSADVVSFDVIDPLEYKGLNEIKRRLESWFSTFQGSTIGFGLGELKITAGKDIAFSHGLNHVNAKTLEGGKLDMWWRQTVCYRKVSGKWMVTHVHSSVPFNTKSGKASLDLKPLGM